MATIYTKAALAATHFEYIHTETATLERVMMAALTL